MNMGSAVASKQITHRVKTLRRVESDSTKLSESSIPSRVYQHLILKSRSRMYTKFNVNNATSLVPNQQRSGIKDANGFYPYNQYCVFISKPIYQLILTLLKFTT